MSGSSGTQTTKNEQSLPPQFQRAMDQILQGASELRPRFEQKTKWVPNTKALTAQDFSRNMDGMGINNGYAGVSKDFYNRGPGTQTAGLGKYVNVGDPVNVGGPTSIVPDFSQQTLQGLDMLTSGGNQDVMNLMTQAAQGNYLDSNPYSNAINAGGMNPYATQTNQYSGSINPYTSTTGIEGVQDAIQRASTKAVSDRFTQAGRGGGPAESMALSNEVARTLAPYAFNANESAQNRFFGGAENRINRMTDADERAIARSSQAGQDVIDRQYRADETAANRGYNAYQQERATQMNAARNLQQMDSINTNNMLQAGIIREQQERQKMLEPFELYNLQTDPLIRALGGAPKTSTSTQPVNRNRAAGALGGASAGATIGSAVPVVGTAVGAVVGGILGAI